jgi:4-hydroxy-tetrahydrodipicolinate reductase
MRIGIAGAGRMGLSIADVIASSADLTLAGIWTRHPEKAASALVPEGAYIGEDIAQLIAHSDVLVDFSLPRGTEQAVQALSDSSIPLVCGVSGLSDKQFSALKALAKTSAVVYDRNMSIGVTVLSRLVKDAAEAMGDRFEVRIDETHHIHKQDAPSGTALKLGEQIAAARGRTLDELRHEATDKAPLRGQINFRVERRGEVPGEHSVHFESPTETLVLSHCVTSRAVFAEGAVAAARWIIGQPAAGLYTMQDVLF